MKSRPILFNGDMVRAILDGRKTQTRRPVKPQPTNERNGLIGHVSLGGYFASHVFGACMAKLVESPLGQPGDELWVQETWVHYHTVDHRRLSNGASFSEVSDGLAGYRADGYENIEDFRSHVRLMCGHDLEAVEINGNNWRPSTQMKRWASRITLVIDDVHVERLQDISEDDVIAEGIEHTGDRIQDGAKCSGPVSVCGMFRALWDRVTPKNPWASNPWVWVVKFHRKPA